MGNIVVSMLMLVLATGCVEHSAEEKFFEGPSADRVERMQSYSLEDQYKIFRYGNEAEPPDLELAVPIAKRGKMAVPFLLAKLEVDKDQISVRDILQVFEVMQESGSYDVRSDAKVMALLERSVERIRGNAWGPICVSILEDIKHVEIRDFTK